MAPTASSWKQKSSADSDPSTPDESRSRDSLLDDYRTVYTQTPRRRPFFGLPPLVTFRCGCGQTRATIRFSIFAVVLIFVGCLVFAHFPHAMHHGLGLWGHRHHPPQDSLYDLEEPEEPKTPWVHAEEAWEPRDPPRKALILASYKKQNVTWLRDIPTDWEIFRYVHDDKNAQYTSGAVGNEANTYLTFIINHYNNLPDYMVFLHGHDRGWHQPEYTAQKVRALNLDALRQEGYISLRCSQKPGCTNDSKIRIKNPHENPDDHRWMLDVLPGFLEWMFPEIKEPPEALSSPCCAQFAVSKGQVRRRSKVWWRKYRWPLIKGIWRWSVHAWNAPDPGIGRYKAGVAYEKTYHLAFGKPPIYCPDEDLCRKHFYSDMIHCDRYTGAFRDSKDWENITCTDTLPPIPEDLRRPFDDSPWWHWW